MAATGLRIMAIPGSPGGMRGSATTSAWRSSPSTRASAPIEKLSTFEAPSTPAEAARVADEGPLSLSFYAIDDYLTCLEKFPAEPPEKQLDNPAWHIHGGHPPAPEGHVSFGLLLNRAAVCNTEDPAVLWGFITRYAPDATPATAPILDRLVRHAIHYYVDFVKPTKRYRAPAPDERTALEDLATTLEKLPAGADAEGELGEEHDPETHLIPLVIQAVLGRRAPVEVFGTNYPTPDGTAIRDYIDVRDLAEAHVLALRSLMEGGQCLAMNLGTGQGHSVREVIAAVERVSKLKVPARDAARRAGDPPVLVADPSRAAQVLGWKPRHSTLDEIVESAWKWAVHLKA